MWRESVAGWSTDCKFNDAASTSQIGAVEKTLAVKFPDALVSLLLETNGIVGPLGIGLIWPLMQIESDNLAFRLHPNFRNLYMSFDQLLFFADAGNGDQFAFRALIGVAEYEVFVWDHESDSRTWVAPSLQKYLEWSLIGKLKLRSGI